MSHPERRKKRKTYLYFETEICLLLLKYGLEVKRQTQPWHQPHSTTDLLYCTQTSTLYPVFLWLIGMTNPTLVDTAYHFGAAESASKVKKKLHITTLGKQRKSCNQRKVHILLTF
ncbi:hypothetical protein V6Z11_D08G171700 [Gossypium hirsutum]